MAKKADKLNLIVHPQNSDGNCMFAAIATQLKFYDGIVTTHQDVRQQIVEHIRQNPTLVCVAFNIHCMYFNRKVFVIVQFLHSILSDMSVLSGYRMSLTIA